MNGKRMLHVLKDGFGVCVFGGGWGDGWREGGREGAKEGGNHSAMNALWLGPVFITAAPMTCGKWEGGTEGQKESRAQIRILTAMIITVCHPVCHTCSKCRWLSYLWQFNQSVCVCINVFKHCLCAQKSLLFNNISLLFNNIIYLYIIYLMYECMLEIEKVRGITIITVWVRVYV